MGRCHHVDSVVHSMKILLLIAKCQSLSNKLDMLTSCTLQMHVQQATYANELHVNVQQYKFYPDTHIRVFFPLGVGRDAEVGQLGLYYTRVFLIILFYDMPWTVMNNIDYYH